MSSLSTGLSDEERKSGAGGCRGGLGPQWDHHDAFTVEETGKILGLSRGSAFAAAKRGDIPTIRIGKRLIVPRHALERLLGIEAVGQAVLQVAAAPPAPAPQRVEVAIQVTAPPRGSGRTRKHVPTTAELATEEATTA
jgi:hypothetical protein